MKKTNPRKRPATWADVNRAKDKAVDEAVVTALAMFLIVLVDKFNGADYIMDVWKEINKMSDMVSEGYVSIADIKNTLREEYGIILS